MFYFWEKNEEMLYQKPRYARLRQEAISLSMDPTWSDIKPIKNERVPYQYYQVKFFKI